MKQQVVLYSRPGTDLHASLCDAFMAHAGWVAIEEAFYEIVTMTAGWGPAAKYTRWTLRAAAVGRA